VVRNFAEGKGLTAASLPGEEKLGQRKRNRQRQTLKERDRSGFECGSGWCVWLVVFLGKEGKRKRVGGPLGEKVRASFLSCVSGR